MIKKLAIPFSLAAVAALAACASTQNTVVTAVEQTPYVAYPAALPVSGPARTGSGKVALLTDLSGPVADISTQRVTLRMNDGSVQTIDVRGEQLKQGEEIAIRSDSTIRREPRM